MEKTIVVKNHVFLLPELEKKYDRIIYAPSINSDVQEAFFQKAYDEIKELIPKTEWDIKDIPNDSDYLAWDAHDENRFFKNKRLPYQNRLFDDLTFDIPDSFTAFRKKAEKVLPLKFENTRKPFMESVQKELDYYFNEKKLASTYFKTRNGLVGRDFSTKFSSLLSNGFLDVRYLYNEVKKFEEVNGANKSTYWIIFELLWREFFFHHYQKWGSHYFSENGLHGKKTFIQFKKYEIEELRHMSPNSFFTAALNELEKTGFQSNRVRQIFASIWLNDLSLNWRSGADLFERYLIDYDVFSNYGNWMYLAGVGVDPRGKRYFKLSKQLDNYDPERIYEKTWMS